MLGFFKIIAKGLQKSPERLFLFAIAFVCAGLAIKIGPLWGAIFTILFYISYFIYMHSKRKQSLDQAELELKNKALDVKLKQQEIEMAKIERKVLEND